MPKGGCYFLEYWPIQQVDGVSCYQGTLRIDDDPADLHRGDSVPVCSGDLYECPAGGHDCFTATASDEFPELRHLVRDLVVEPWLNQRRGAKPSATEAPDIFAKPAPKPPLPGSIPIFPRHHYIGYLELTQLALPDDTSSGNFNIPFRAHRYDSLRGVFKKPEDLTFNVTPQRDFKALQSLKKARQSGSASPLSINELDPSTHCHYWGIVTDRSGNEVAFFALYWISEYLRRAVLEIDHVGDRSSSLAHEKKASWKKVFDGIRWKLTKVYSEVIPEDRVRKIKDRPDMPWTSGELHVAMQAFRNEVDLDEEWRYHMLCVPRLENGARGVSYDVGLSVGNIEPREGMAVASDYRFPKSEVAPMPNAPQIPFLYERNFWGDVAGQSFADQPELYFRTAVHEVGHLMNLAHNQKDTGFMNATNVIAYNSKLRQAAKSLSEQANARERLAKIKDVGVTDLVHSGPTDPGSDAGKHRRGTRGSLPNDTSEDNAKALDAVLTEMHEQSKEELSRRHLRARKALDDVKPFPENVVYAFHNLDVERLRHSPDIMVRPGTLFSASNTPLARHRSRLAKKAAGLRLDVTAHEKRVPLGAPVRVNFRLTNFTDRSDNPMRLFLPRSLSLKRGHVRGQVRDPEGVKRHFHPLMVIDDHEYDIEGLAPGQSRAHSLSLLHGSRQSLFPKPGRYQITVEIEWELYGSTYRETGETTLFTISNSTNVEITGALELTHRRACETLLNDPDILIGFAFRPSLNQDLAGPPSALRTALACPQLNPHYHIVRANQYYEEVVQGVSPDSYESLTRALESIRPDSLLSVSEIWRVWQICWEAENGYSIRFFNTLRDSKKTRDICEKNCEVVVARMESQNGAPFPYFLFCRDANGSFAESNLALLDSAGRKDLLDRLNKVWEAPFVGLHDKTEIIRVVMAFFDHKPEIERIDPYRFKELKEIVTATKKNLRTRFLELQDRGVVDSTRHEEDYDLVCLLSADESRTGTGGSDGRSAGVVSGRPEDLKEFLQDLIREGWTDEFIITDLKGKSGPTVNDWKNTLKTLGVPLKGNETEKKLLGLLLENLRKLQRKSDAAPHSP